MISDKLWRSLHFDILFFKIDSHFFLQDWIDHSIPQSDSSFNPHVVFVGVLISMINFELFPNSPEWVLVLTWITILTQMNIHGTSPFDFIQLSLKFGESQTELHKQLIRFEFLKCPLVNFTTPCDPVKLGCLCNVEAENVEELGSLRKFFRCSIVNFHSMWNQSKILFKVCVHKQK